MNRVFSFALLVPFVIMLASLSACGGGSSTPGPGGQQPATQADPPDPSLIIAQYDSVLGELTIIGGSGSVEANAFVDVEDPQRYSASVQADGSGAFIFSQSDLPSAFWITPGIQLEVSQRTVDLLPSNAVVITIGTP